MVEGVFANKWILQGKYSPSVAGDILMSAMMCEGGPIKAAWEKLAWWVASTRKFTQCDEHCMYCRLLRVPCKISSTKASSSAISPLPVIRSVMTKSNIVQLVCVRACVLLLYNLSVCMFYGFELSHGHWLSPLQSQTKLLHLYGCEPWYVCACMRVCV